MKTEEIKKKINIENQTKQEKGAISTLVLFTVLMFVTILMSVFITVGVRQKSGLKSSLRIAEVYREDVEKIDDIYGSVVKYSTTYNYTGNVQVFEVPYTGIYQIECWGAQGGNIDNFTGGKGAYTKGNISLNKGKILYIYVGGQGTNTDVGGYNGGGSLTKGQSIYGASGGGATDIRLVGGEWNNNDSLKSRIMVAAGGGGANNRNRGDSTYMYGAGNGGAGGELTGESGSAVNYTTSGNIPTYNGHNIGTGGTQTQGGSILLYDTSGNLLSSTVTGKFGDANSENETQSGGGSGYYGGGYSGHGGAGGGSSFISGYSGCDAINSSGTHTGQSHHFSGYVFSKTQIIAGSKEMPKKNEKGTMVGNSGNGFVKIEKIKAK